MKKILSFLVLFTCFAAMGAALKITQLPTLSNSSATSADVTAMVDVSADVTKQFSLGEFDKRYHAVTVGSGDNEGFWILQNATYDEGTDKFNRTDVSATAYGINLRTEPIPGGSESGIVLWKVDPGLNPVSGTFNVSGGWKPLLSLTESGEATLLASPVSSDHSKKIATTEFVNNRRMAIATIQNFAGGAILNQWDGILNDAFASVSQTTSGTVVVTMKSGYWTNPTGTGHPEFFCNAYGASQAYSCNIATPSVPDPYTFQITVYDSSNVETGAYIRLMAVGQGQ